MRREHDRATFGNFGQVVNEDDAAFTETVDDDAVVNDLVVAVHRRLEGAHQPTQRLDGHLDACAKAARGRKQDLVNVRVGHRFHGTSRRHR